MAEANEIMLELDPNQDLIGRILLEYGHGIKPSDIINELKYAAHPNKFVFDTSIRKRANRIRQNNKTIKQRGTGWNVPIFTKSFYDLFLPNEHLKIIFDRAQATMKKVGFATKRGDNSVDYVFDNEDAEDALATDFERIVNVSGKSNVGTLAINSKGNGEVRGPTFVARLTHIQLKLGPNTVIPGLRIIISQRHADDGQSIVKYMQFVQRIASVYDLPFVSENR